jgi:vacuolar-type H+-ATPase subunit H
MLQTFSTIDFILQTESELTERMDAAQKAASAQIQLAQVQAQKIKEDALKAGRQDGHAGYEQELAAAQVEADSIIARAGKQAQLLDNLSPAKIRKLACLMRDVVLGFRQAG